MLGKLCSGSQVVLTSVVYFIICSCLSCFSVILFMSLQKHILSVGQQAVLTAAALASSCGFSHVYLYLWL
jgi:hypothetical protein